MDKGLTTTDPAVSDLKRPVMGIARRKMLVGTHTEFGLFSFSRFADVEGLDVLVTGKRPGQPHGWALSGEWCPRRTSLTSSLATGPATPAPSRHR